MTCRLREIAVVTLLIMSLGCEEEPLPGAINASSKALATANLVYEAALDVQFVKSDGAPMPAEWVFEIAIANEAGETVFVTQAATNEKGVASYTDLPVGTFTLSFTDELNIRYETEAVLERTKNKPAALAVPLMDY